MPKSVVTHGQIRRILREMDRLAARNRDTVQPDPAGNRAARRAAARASRHGTRIPGQA